MLSVIEGGTGLPPVGDPFRDEAVEVIEEVAEHASERDVSLTTHVQPGTSHEVITNCVSTHEINPVSWDHTIAWGYAVSSLVASPSGYCERAKHPYSRVTENWMRVVYCR